MWPSEPLAPPYEAYETVISESFYIALRVGMSPRLVGILSEVPRQEHAQFLASCKLFKAATKWVDSISNGNLYLQVELHGAL